VLIKYSLAALCAFYDDNFENFQELPVKEAIYEFYDSNKVEHFRVNFNSPGRFEAIFAKKSASTLLSIILKTVTTSSHKNIVTAKNEAAAEVKSAINGSAREVETDVDRLTNAMRDPRWDAIRQELGLLADEELDLNLDRDRSIDDL
jgi:hypothetical protein